MIKELLLSVLLIGFLFNVFHDFVFYKIDPCMKTVESLKSPYEPKSVNDPLCDIHHNLHLKYIFNEDINLSIEDNLIDFYPINLNLFPQEIPQEIFRPPTLT